MSSGRRCPDGASVAKGVDTACDDIVVSVRACAHLFTPPPSPLVCDERRMPRERLVPAFVTSLPHNLYDT
jgi:hypothetical protein